MTTFLLLPITLGDVVAEILCFFTIFLGEDFSSLGTGRGPRDFPSDTILWLSRKPDESPEIGGFGRLYVPPRTASVTWGFKPLCNISFVVGILDSGTTIIIFVVTELVRYYNFATALDFKLCGAISDIDVPCTFKSFDTPMLDSIIHDCCEGWWVDWDPPTAIGVFSLGASMYDVDGLR